VGFLLFDDSFLWAEFTAAYAKIYTGTVPPSAIARNRQTVKNIAEFLTSPLNRPF
jgi:hypothetical protein